MKGCDSSISSIFDSKLEEFAGFLIRMGEAAKVTAEEAAEGAKGLMEIQRRATECRIDFEGYGMTHQIIQDRIKETIDQFYRFYEKDGKAPDEKRQLYFIAGILQTTLRLLPNDRYFEIKRYVYDRYGYDPGGVETGQIELEEWMAFQKGGGDKN